jgi:enamine deaminase RidA (YjgF/YER057c/UK114 family)
MGLYLPTPPKAVAKYAPWKLEAGLVYISGQLPLQKDGSLILGQVGDIAEDQAYEAVQLCAINLLAQAEEARLASGCSQLKAVKLSLFINAIPGFIDHSILANRASEIVLGALGEQHGAHARSAVGVATLPRGVPVELEAIFSLSN